MNLRRWYRKAEAVYGAWMRRNGTAPSKATVIKVLCVAQFETLCGDAWPGPDGFVETADDENNWGACTLRALNAIELQTIAKAGIAPTVGKGHEAIAKAAMKALAGAGLKSASGTVLGVEVPSSTIHCDSKPVKGGMKPYFVWFANFASEQAGAQYLIAMLCGSQNTRAAYRTIVDPDSSLYQLASDMRAAGYYSGFYEQKKIYEDGKTGYQKNIDAYASGLERIGRVLDVALKHWEHGANPDEAPKPFELPTLKRYESNPVEAVKTFQTAVNKLPKPTKFRDNAGREIEWPDTWAWPIAVDGNFGKRTERAAMYLQATCGVPMKIDGIVGKMTWNVVQKLGLV